MILQVIERERLYLLALRTKPSVNALQFHQPAELFNQQFPNLQVCYSLKQRTHLICKPVSKPQTRNF